MPRGVLPDRRFIAPGYYDKLIRQIIDFDDPATTPEAVAEPASNTCLDADAGELIPREIDGFVIHQRAKDGYVNATAMCKAAGKLLNDWSRNAGTQKVLALLASRTGILVGELVISDKK